MTIYSKNRLRRYIAVGQRDLLGITAIDRVQLIMLSKYLESAVITFKILKLKGGGHDYRREKLLQIMQLISRAAILILEIDFDQFTAYRDRARSALCRRTIASFAEQCIRDGIYFAANIRELAFSRTKCSALTRRYFI